MSSTSEGGDVTVTGYPYCIAQYFIPFGETLTDQAHFPKLKLKDPYKKKGMAPWKKWSLSGLPLLVVLAVMWLCNLFAWAQLPSPLPWFAKEEVAEECILEETTLESAEEACCTGETTGTL